LRSTLTSKRFAILIKGIAAIHPKLLTVEGHCALDFAGLFDFRLAATVAAVMGFLGLTLAIIGRTGLFLFGQSAYA
jgi:hypothetical protein